MQHDAGMTHTEYAICNRIGSNLLQILLIYLRLQNKLLNSIVGPNEKLNIYTQVELLIKSLPLKKKNTDNISFLNTKFQKKGTAIVMTIIFYKK